MLEISVRNGERLSREQIRAIWAAEDIDLRAIDRHEVHEWITGLNRNRS
jgi:hypothetical protein